jgi:rubrerythrin
LEGEKVTDLSERLYACIEVEKTVSEIYRRFAELFPTEKAFWEQLALEEENHVAILMVGRIYHRKGELPDYVVPPSLPLVGAAFHDVKKMKDKAMEGTITLEEASRMALEAEENIVESYFQEVMTKETDSKVLSSLKRLMHDTELHVKKISQFMDEKGFKKP